MNGFKCGRSLLVGISAAALFALAPALHAQALSPLNVSQNVTNGSVWDTSGSQTFHVSQSNVLSSFAFELAGPQNGLDYGFNPTSMQQLRISGNGVNVVSPGGVVQATTGAFSNDWFYTANFANVVLAPGDYTASFLIPAARDYYSVYSGPMWNGYAFVDYYVGESYYTESNPLNVLVASNGVGGAQIYTGYSDGNININGGGSAAFDGPSPVVPEPKSVIMLLLGAILVGGYVKLQRRSCPQAK